MRIGMNGLRPWIAACALFVAAAVVSAEVTTSLSTDVAQVGQPVMLVYRFVNTPEPEDMPRPSIMVDGLKVVFQGAGRQNKFSFSFGGRGGSQNRSESIVEYTYAVVPLRPGEFTIPGFEVRVGGQLVRTQPARLRVSGPGGYAAQQAQPAPNVPGGAFPLAQAQPQAAPGAQQRTGRAERPYFGELLMTTKPVYLGEVVPADIRFYFREDLPLTNLQHPVFSGDGFTAVPLDEPKQDGQLIDGVPYRVFTFRSAITPVKTGEIEIPAVTMNGNVVVSSAPRGLDPFFDQFFQNFPMPGMGRTEQIEVSADGKTLTVLPLPKEGRPANYEGAVGQFTLQSSVAPSSAGPGEPVTLSVEISGRGNFDAISAPRLTDADGWRTYAPKEKFAKDDAVGSAGTKTFEFKMVARTDQTATPGAEFSFFDPLKKEYVTLKAAPKPVRAAGREQSADEKSAPSPASAPATPSAPVSAASPSGDGIASPALTLSSTTSRSFVPVWHAPWFRWLNVALLVVAAIVFPLFALMRRRGQKLAERSGLEKALRQAKSALQQAPDREAFYNAAAEFVRARLELLAGRAGSVADLPTALRQHVTDPEQLRGLQSVLTRRDELKYGGGGGSTLAANERQDVMALLEKFAAQK